MQLERLHDRRDEAVGRIVLDAAAMSALDAITSRSSQVPIS